MPTVLTGAAADPTTSPQATGPASGDVIASGALDTGAFQPILNFISWLRTHIVPDTGGTYTGAVTFNAAANGATPTAAAHLTRKDYVDAGLAAGLAAFTTAPYSAPQSLTLGTGWSGTLRYGRDKSGWVHLEGGPTKGSTGVSIAGNLPAGFRPFADISFVIWAGSNPYRITVQASGDINTSSVPTTTVVDFGTVSFFGAQ